MSNALAIAAVTAVLKDLLGNGLKAYKVSDIVGGDVTVSALPPDRVVITGSEDPTQLNLFLHQVTPNQGWRNVALPSRNANGERVASPPLALNLHYLLTAYGAKDLYPEIILGHAMQLLHETAVLTRDAIRKALAPLAPPPEFPSALATSELADQVEQLRITPETMNTEEVSRLWAALGAHYRSTAAYQVAVVLIESSRSIKPGLPVGDPGRNIYVLPFHQPVIERVVAAAGETAPISAASTLLIQGQHLRASPVQVRVGNIDLTSAVAAVRETEITVPLPSPLPAGLYAGVQVVRVIHPIEMGTPPALHRGFESNVAVFVLRPAIAPPTVENLANDGTIDGVAAKKGEIKVDFNPKIEKRQRVMLLLNQFNAPPSGPARAYSFKAPVDNGITGANTETATIRFPFKGVVAGAYLIRAQVDGAESVLTVDGSGQYANPRVTI